VARVTMYSRTTCGLCDQAREIILAVRAEVPFDYQEVFVDGRDDLERAYGLRVPVVLIDGQEAFEVDVDPALFEASVRRA
jgi:glutaredoxin